MKLQIIKQEILKILHLAQEASENNNFNSYFSYFIFIAEQETLIIKSANRQMTFEQKIESNEYNKLGVFEEGSFLIPGTKILNIVNTLHDGMILFEVKDLNLVIVEEGKNKRNIEFNIRIKPIGDYPQNIHKKIDNEFCLVNKNDFYTIINNTSFAVSSSIKDSSMFLTGVYLDIEDNVLSAVATDRNRMSISYIEVDNISILKSFTENDIIIPLKFVVFLKKILKNLEEKSSLLISIDNDRMFFQLENLIVTANLISGKYYDYKKIIPKEKRNNIKINTLELREAVSRISVITDNKRENTVLFTIEKDQILISAEEKEKSKAKETLNAKIEGGLGNFLIKSQFILDPLNVINTEQVCIEYGNNVKDLIKITALPVDHTLHIAAQLNQ